MEKFRKVRTWAEGRAAPFPDLPPEVVEMRVKEGSKIRSLMGFATAKMEAEDTRQILFSGCGRAVTKTVTCAEILKRNLRSLHQSTKVQFQTLREEWESSPPDGRAQRITVHRNVPSICILLSKDPPQSALRPPDPPRGPWDSARDGPRRSPKRGLRTPPSEGDPLRKKALCEDSSPAESD